MNILLIIIVVIALLVLFVFTAALRVKFAFYSEKPDIRLTLLWLYPFFKAEVTNEDTAFFLTVYLLDKAVFRKRLQSGKSRFHNTEIISSAKPKDINVSAAYGFRDPFVTGIALGAVNAASRFVKVDTLQQEPDFLAQNDYIHVDATAKLNLGTTLVNLYKAHGTKNRNPI